MTLEAEIKIQHIIDSLHIEILGIELVIPLAALAVNESRTLISTCLDISVIGEVLGIERKTEIIFAVDVP